MRSPKVFVTRPVPGSPEDLLARHGYNVKLQAHDRPIGRQELLHGVGGVHALLCLLTDRIDDEVLDAAGPDLRVVANFAVGYDNIDLEAANARGIAVTNTPDVLTEATADLAMTLLLAAARRVRAGERLVRSGRWEGWGPNQLLGRGLQGAMLGIVGLGAIGTATATRARAFGMRIQYHNRSPNPPAEAATGAKFVPLNELLSTSDFISLHAPLTQETHHLVDAEALATTRPGVIVVNTSRGPLIDEAALVEALERGQVGAAGLDVFEEEPRIHLGLIDRDDVVLLPHLGSATWQARSAMGRLCAENIHAVLEGRDPVTPVSRIS